MKKFVILTVMLFCFISLVGCGTNARVIEKNDIFIKKEIKSNVLEKYNVEANQFSSWFNVKPEDFMTEVNRVAFEKGYQPLSKLREDSNMYTDNGETWYINIGTKSSSEEGTGKIKEVELSLFSDSEERSKKNGEFIYILINEFIPGQAELIVDELHIFDDQDDLQNSRYVQCGNTVFYYYMSDIPNAIPEFKIFPAEVRIAPSPKEFIKKPE